MSLRRGVAVIQAAGLAGTPSACQFMTAAAKASCIASSARSKERQTRMSPAMMRPDSWRKTDWTVARWSCIHEGRLREFANGPDLDTPGQTRAGSGYSCCPGQRFIKVFAVEDVVSG